MKKLILNFEDKGTDFKELVQEAFNKDILNFLVSNDTYPEFENIERINIYSIHPFNRVQRRNAGLSTGFLMSTGWMGLSSCPTDPVAFFRWDNWSWQPIFAII